MWSKDGGVQGDGSIQGGGVRLFYKAQSLTSKKKALETLVIRYHQENKP